MLTRHLKIWQWLLLLAVGLLLFRLLAPVSDLLDQILTGVTALLFLACTIGSWREVRREQQADQPNSAAVSSGDQT